MKPYFTQLPVSIDMLNPANMNLTARRSFNNKNYYSAINNPDYSDYLHSIFKDLKFRDISYSEFPGAWPHIDHDGTTCAINHYYDTHGVETCYYEFGLNGAKPYAGESEENACFYNKEDLILVDKFCAEPNSVWLLDTTKIHSLEFVNGWGPVRTFIKWRFNFPYEEVYSYFFKE